MPGISGFFSEPAANTFEPMFGKMYGQLAPDQKQFVLAHRGDTGANTSALTAAATKAGTGLEQQPDESNFHHGVRSLGTALGMIANAMLPQNTVGTLGDVANFANAKPVAAPAPAATSAPQGSMFNNSTNTTPTPAAPGLKHATTLDNLVNQGILPGGSGTGSPTLADIMTSGIYPQESGSRAGAIGPQTQYGQAKGEGQVLDTTGEATARKHGIQWIPALMTGTSPQAKAYQEQISTLVMQDNLAATGGNVPAAIALYHAGSPAGVGQNTTDYTRQVLAKLAGHGLNVAQPIQMGAFNMPGMASVDPAAAMQMLTPPEDVPKTVLPAAPQLQAPAPASPYEQEDKGALLAQLTAAAQPVAPQQSTFKDRILAALAGANVDGSGSNELNQIGSGALKGVLSEKEKDDAKQQAYAEQMRQVQIMLAQAGIGIDENNLNTRNKNLDRSDASKNAGINTSNTNLVNADARQVQQALDDAATARTNVGTHNTFKLERSKVGLGAMEGQASAYNETQKGQATLDSSAVEIGKSLDAHGFNPQVTSVLQKAQIEPDQIKNAKDPIWKNAAETAQNVAAGNDNLAFGSLANELVMNGNYAKVVGPQSAAAVKKAIQQKNGPEAARIVSEQLNALAADPKLRQQLIQVVDGLAASGASPSAMIISRNLKRDAPTGH